MALKIEVELCKGHNILARPASPPHVVEQGGLCYRHLAPCQVLVWGYLVEWLEQERVIGLGECEGVLGDCNGLPDRLHPLWHTRRTGVKP